MDRITFKDPESGDMLEAYILEQTCIGGVAYFLVTEEEKEDSIAYILKEVQSSTDEMTLQIVDDDTELAAISRVFAEMLDDVDFEM